MTASANKRWSTNPRAAQRRTIRRSGRCNRANILRISIHVPVPALAVRLQHLMTPPPFPPTPALATRQFPKPRVEISNGPPNTYYLHGGADRRKFDATDAADAQRRPAAAPASAEGSCESRHSRHSLAHLQHARICRATVQTGRVVDRRPTSSARQASVGLQPSCSGTCMAGSKLSGNVVATTKIHLIWRLAGEGRMRDHGVVLLHIEADELLQGREGVELV